MAEKKKKALLITFLFGDQSNVGQKGVGSVRVSYVARALSKKFDLTVMTRKGEEDKGYNCIAKFDNSSLLNPQWIPFYNTFLFLFVPIDPSIFWYNKLKKDILSNKEFYSKFDVVYINSPPFMISLLSKVFKEINEDVKVVIDYRDVWGYPYFSKSIFSLPAGIIGKPLSQHLEKKAMTNADLLIFNTPSNHEYYSKMYGKDKAIYYSNGYDKSILKSVKSSKSDIKIVYAGDFQFGRNINIVLDVVKESFPGLKVDLFGNYSSFIKFKLRKYKDIIVYHDRISRKDLTNVLHNANILLVSQDMRSYKPWAPIAYKTYEYLALGKPIIYTGPEVDNSRLIEKYSKHHLIISDYSDMSFRKKQVEDFIRKHVSSGDNIPEPSKEFLEKFDANSIADDIADSVFNLIH